LAPFSRIALVWFSNNFLYYQSASKERSYYLGSLLGSSIILLIFLVFLGQKFLALILMAAMTMLSVVTLSVSIKMQTREATDQLKETDVKAALRLSDFLTCKGLLKLAHRYEVIRTICIYFALTFVGVACTLYVLSIYGIGTIESAVGNAVLASLLISITFHRIISKALKKTK